MERIHPNIPVSAMDLRKDYRSQLETLRRRVNLLTGQERVLMTMYLENGNSYRQLAQLSGVNETTIARRIHRASRRLADGEYFRCLRNRDRFSSAELSMAKDYFLRGFPMKKISAKSGFSYYRVRKTIKSIKGRLRTMRDN